MLDFAALKKKHRTIFVTEIGGIQVVFRLLTLREQDIYTKVFSMGLTARGKLEDNLFREVVLDEDLINEMNQTPAGLVPAIVGLVMFLSGNPLASESDIERMNNDISLVRDNVAGNIFEQFIILICRAFPSMTPNEVEDLEFPELLRLSLMAEQILNLEEPISLKTPKQKESFLERAFSDASGAERFESARGGPRTHIKDVIAERGQATTPKQARDLETIRRIKERRIRS